MRAPARGRLPEIKGRGPADKVERWRIERLIPYAKNARTHSDAQIAAIAASIKEWGWTTPASRRCDASTPTWASAAARSARCRRGTPFGRPVVPEV